MFTGIIQRAGTIKAMGTKANLMVLSVDAGPLAKDVRLGDSVALNGVCLTASGKKGTVIRFDAMRETMTKTALKDLKTGHKVNLELALRPDSRLGGHFVTGHVDEAAVVKRVERAKNWVALTVGISKTNRKYLAPKGSVAVDGISLTVGKVGASDFSVYLVPYTLAVTTLAHKKAGDRVNVETDILAKYVLNASPASADGGNGGVL
ncbi:MAG: riboflavin synthase [Candidatus Omnitrophica bacterium]|nr:riboflavin synthase [Candidatus Omnitrophota bacterium]